MEICQSLIKLLWFSYSNYFLLFSNFILDGLLFHWHEVNMCTGVFHFSFVIFIPHSFNFIFHFHQLILWRKFTCWSNRRKIDVICNFTSLLWHCSLGSLKSSWKLSSLMLFGLFKIRFICCNIIVRKAFFLLHDDASEQSIAKRSLMQK